jgi:L-alanine-DL-glutamate epimerase-like enolase superfamily enzyme
VARLGPTGEGRDPTSTAACWQAMHAALRNAGQPGAGAMALSAVDLALHDLKAKQLGVPVGRLLGPRATPSRSTPAAASARGTPRACASGALSAQAPGASRSRSGARRRMISSA